MTHSAAVSGAFLPPHLPEDARDHRLRSGGGGQLRPLHQDQDDGRHEPEGRRNGHEQEAQKVTAEKSRILIIICLVIKTLLYYLQ